MNIEKLIQSAKITIDEAGHKKVILDWQIWEEILFLLEARFQAQTELGRQLWAARANILAAGIPLLDQETFERELVERRGRQR